MTHLFSFRSVRFRRLALLLVLPYIFNRIWTHLDSKILIDMIPWFSSRVSLSVALLSVCVIVSTELQCPQYELWCLWWCSLVRIVPCPEFKQNRTCPNETYNLIHHSCMCVVWCETMFFVLLDLMFVSEINDNFPPWNILMIHDDYYWCDHGERGANDHIFQNKFQL